MDRRPKGQPRRSRYTEGGEVGSVLRKSGALTPTPVGTPAVRASRPESSGSYAPSLADVDFISDEHGVFDVAAVSRPREDALVRQDVHEEVVGLIRQELLDLLRDRLLRPMCAEVLQSRDALLQAFSRLGVETPRDGSTSALQLDRDWAGRCDAKLDRHGSCLEQLLSQQREFQETMRKLGESLPVEDPPSEPHEEPNSDEAGQAATQVLQSQDLNLLRRQSSFEEARLGHLRWQELEHQRISEKLAKSTAIGRIASSITSAVGFPQEAPNTRLSDFARGASFTTACTLLILGNTVFIGLETNMTMEAALRGSAAPAWFQLVNRIFAGLFLVELIIRIAAFRSWWLFGDDWRWNIFDAVLVGTSLVQEVLAGANVSFVRILRILRVVRVARIIRVVRFFRELRRMVCSIVSCLASLAWASLLIVLIMYVFAIFFVQGAAGQLQDEPAWHLRAELQLWYRSVPVCMYALLLSVSGGYDWWNILEPLIEINESHKVVFTFYIFFMLFGVLNVMTGVFLESATEFMDKDLVIQAQVMRADQFVKEMESLFGEFDTEKVGWLSRSRFEECMECEEFIAYLASHQLDCSDAYTLFQLLDQNDQGQIDIHQFIYGCLRLKGTARSIEIAVLLREHTRLREDLRSQLASPRQEHQSV